YQDALVELVKSKVAGQTPVIIQEEELPVTFNFADALKQSLESVGRPPAAENGKREAPAKAPAPATGTEETPPAPERARPRGEEEEEEGGGMPRPAGKQETAGRPAPLLGQRVTFTGRFATLTREQAQTLVQQSGGALVADVSARATMLVVGMRGWPLMDSGRLP